MKIITFAELEVQNKAKDKKDYLFSYHNKFMKLDAAASDSGGPLQYFDSYVNEKWIALEYQPISVQDLAASLVMKSIITIPSSFRNFWANLKLRSEKEAILRFISLNARSSILAKEAKLLDLSRERNSRSFSDDLKVHISVAKGEVFASFVQDESTLTLIISVPIEFPLKNVEIICRDKLGMEENRWRRWILQMIQLINNSEKSLIDAVFWWKANIQKQIEGIDPCPICYSILHTRNSSLPSLKCPTCRNKFHANCLHTWFKSSGKSKCVVCQQPFTS